MINVNNSTQASANFIVPEASSPVAPTIEGFSTVYTGNPTQFATKDQADALASFLGGKVTDIADQWSVFHVSPLYQVELPNGVSLNAGLLADRFRRYGTEAALKMTEAEVGGPISVSTQTASPNAAQAATVASADAFVSPPATTQAAEPLTPGTDTANSSPATPEAAPAIDDSAKVLAAAKQFEALLLGTILKSATPEDGGGVLSGQGDSAGASVYQMAMEQFAQLMSDQGGLGLANQVTEQIRSTRTRVSTVA